jgi:hypothetical protein
MYATFASIGSPISPPHIDDHISSRCYYKAIHPYEPAPPNRDCLSRRSLNFQARQQCPRPKLSPATSRARGFRFIGEVHRSSLLPPAIALKAPAQGCGLPTSPRRSRSAVALVYRVLGTVQAEDLGHRRRFRGRRLTNPHGSDSNPWIQYNNRYTVPAGRDDRIIFVFMGFYPKRSTTTQTIRPCAPLSNHPPAGERRRDESSGLSAMRNS